MSSENLEEAESKTTPSPIVSKKRELFQIKEAQLKSVQQRPILLKKHVSIEGDYYVSQISCHPSSSKLLSYSCWDGSVHVLNFQTNEIRYKQNGILKHETTFKNVTELQYQHEAAVLTNTFSSTEMSWLFSAGCDQKVSLFDFEKQNIISTSKEQSSAISNIFCISKEFSSNTLLSFSWNGSCTLWDTREPNYLQNNLNTTISLSQKEFHLSCADVKIPQFAVCDLHHVYLYDMRNGTTPFQTIEVSLEEQIRCIKFSLINESVFVGTDSGKIGEYYFKQSTDKHYTWKTHRIGNRVYAVNHLSTALFPIFSTTQPVLASVGDDACVYFWNTMQQHKTHQLPMETGPITSCCFSTNQKYFFYASHDKQSQFVKCHTLDTDSAIHKVATSNYYVSAEEYSSEKDSTVIATQYHFGEEEKGILDQSNNTSWTEATSNMEYTSAAAHLVADLSFAAYCKGTLFTNFEALKKRFATQEESNTIAVTKDTLTTLPLEIMMEILTYLSFKEWILIRLTCQQIYHAVSNQSHLNIQHSFYNNTTIWKSFVNAKSMTCNQLTLTHWQSWKNISIAFTQLQRLILYMPFQVTCYSDRKLPELVPNCIHWLDLVYLFPLLQMLKIHHAYFDSCKICLDIQSLQDPLPSNYSLRQIELSHCKEFLMTKEEFSIFQSLASTMLNNVQTIRLEKCEWNDSELFSFLFHKEKQLSFPQLKELALHNVYNFPSGSLQQSAALSIPQQSPLSVLDLGGCASLSLTTVNSWLEQLQYDLQILDLTGVILWDQYLLLNQPEILLPYLHNIQHLILQFIYIPCEIVSKLCEHAKMLIKLDLSNSVWTGNHQTSTVAFSNAMHLQELHLQKVTCCQTQKMQISIQNCPKLRYINLSDAELVQSVGDQYITSSLLQDDSLYISYCENIETICLNGSIGLKMAPFFQNLSHVKVIHLNRCIHLQNEALLQLSKVEKEFKIYVKKCELLDLHYLRQQIPKAQLNFF